MAANLFQFWCLPDHPPTHPTCFIIPSYALKDRTLPTRPTRAQIELAYTLWMRFPDSHIILTTCDNQGLGVTNARVMADYAVKLGIPRHMIIEEEQSNYTIENLRNAMQIVQAQGWGAPTLVTIDLYTRRAVATARKLGWGEFYWLSVFAHGEAAYGIKALQTYSRGTIFTYELLAMVYSKLKGWV